MIWTFRATGDDGPATSTAGDSGRHRHHTAVTGWGGGGIESYTSRDPDPRDRPIALGGPDGATSALAGVTAPTAGVGRRDGRSRRRRRGGGMGRIKITCTTPPSPCHFIVEGYNNNDGASASTSSAANQLARLLCIKGGGVRAIPRAQLGRGASQDGRWELAGHFPGALEGRHGQLIIEYPMTLATP